MLELLFVVDVDAATTGPGAGMRLAERAAAKGSSPFGFVLRGDPSEFPGWTYFPDYFPEGIGFHVGSNSEDLMEPLCILLPGEMLGKGNFSPRDIQDKRLTAAQLSLPVAAPSRPLSAVGLCPSVDVRTSAPHRLDLVFDRGAAGRSLNLSPETPLTLST